MKNFFKSLMEYRPKEVIKHFWAAELDDLNREIRENYEIIRALEIKRERAELMAFGN